MLHRIVGLGKIVSERFTQYAQLGFLTSKRYLGHIYRVGVPFDQVPSVRTYWGVRMTTNLVDDKCFIFITYESDGHLNVGGVSTVVGAGTVLHLDRDGWTIVE